MQISGRLERKYKPWWWSWTLGLGSGGGAPAGIENFDKMIAFDAFSSDLEAGP